MVRRSLAVAILSVLMPAAASQAAPEDVPKLEGGVVRLTIAGRKALVPGTSVDGATFVSLKGLAAAAGAKVAAGKTPGDLVVTSAAGKLDFAAARPGLVLATPAGSKSSRALSLAADARPSAGDLFVPLDSIGALVAALQGTALAAGPAETAQVSLLGGEGFMRLVVQPAGDVTWTMDRSGGQVAIRFSGRTGEPPWAARPIGSPILDRIRFETGSDASLTLRLDPGPAFTGVSAVELHDPKRIVVEMRGEVPGVRTLPASDGAAAAPSTSGADSQRRGLQTVVLDPGHGGEAKGAEGPGGLLEKEITLDISNRLAALLRAAGLRVVLTRSADADLGLVDRTAAANRERADLFLSIHVNSSPRRDARGAETYYLAYQAADQDGRDLASAENEGSALGAEGPASSLDLVLWDLAQSEHLRESSQLAEIVQRELNAALDVRDRGVKQAPFRVLMGAAMPAVLIEVGFISNDAEAKSLADGAYRDRIAGALSRAVLAFKQTFDRLRGAGTP